MLLIQLNVPNITKDCGHYAKRNKEAYLYLPVPSFLAQLRSAGCRVRRTSLQLLLHILSLSSLCMLQLLLLLLVQRRERARSKTAVTSMTEPTAGHDRKPLLCGGLHNTRFTTHEAVCVANLGATGKNQVGICDHVSCVRTP